MPYVLNLIGLSVVIVFVYMSVCLSVCLGKRLESTEDDLAAVVNLATAATAGPRRPPAERRVTHS